MERYIPQKGTTEEKHPIIANLFLAKSILEIVESRDFIIENLQNARANLSNRGSVMLELAWKNGGVPAFIFLPSAKHGAGDERRRRWFMLIDDTADLRILVSDRFDLEKIRKPWEDDIVLHAMYNASEGRQTERFSLLRRFPKPISNPKRFLGKRLLQPELEPF